MDKNQCLAKLQELSQLEGDEDFETPKAECIAAAYKLLERYEKIGHPFPDFICPGKDGEICFTWYTPLWEIGCDIEAGDDVEYWWFLSRDAQKAWLWKGKKGTET